MPATRVGGVVSTGYAYAGAKSHLNGRGFLGFHQMTVTDLQTNVVGTTIYRQDFPYVASGGGRDQGASERRRSASTAHAYDATALGGRRYQAFLEQSQASYSTDLDGSRAAGGDHAYKYDT